MSAHAGEILTIDLSNQTAVASPMPEGWLEKYLGGRGIAAQVLWDMVGPETGPHDPDNAVIFAPGSLNATEAPSAGRTTVTFKSPATGGYFKSSAGGHFGPALRRAGYALVVIKGEADRPVWVFIDNGEVTFKDAMPLWGLDVRETTKEIRRQLDDRGVQIACIGPAGERGVAFASIMCSTYNAAARGGGGAVMGVKKLKAVAVRGTGQVKIHNPADFHETCLMYRRLLSEDSGAMMLARLGTSGIVNLVNEGRVLPSYNFQKCYLDDAYKISGEALINDGYLVGRVGCSSCTIACHRFTRVESGAYAGTYSAGPEFETLSALGSGCGITDMAVVLKLNELCNLYGLDTISTGSVIQWTMECYQRGLLGDKDLGGGLGWGDAERAIMLIEEIVNRRGFGDVLARGLKQASEQVGQGSEDFALQIRGLEQSRVDTRPRKGYALAFAVNPRGPDHLHTEAMAESGRTPEAVKLIERITGDKKYATPYILEKRAEIVKWHEECYAATDALGFCAFVTTCAYAVDPTAMARMFTLALGVEMDEGLLMESGERILNLEHAYNVREGVTRKDHRLPKRMMETPRSEGPGEGHRNSKEEMDRLLDDYYTLHGWDLRTARPTRKCLARLGLQTVSEDLDRRGLLPEY